MEEYTVSDRVYILRLCAIHAEATSVRLRQVVELTHQNRDTIMQELGWLPYLVQDIGRLTSVEANRLTVLASCWRADAAQLEADAPTDEDLRDVEFLSTHFNDDVGGIE